MKPYLLLIDKTKINIIWKVLQEYPIDNIYTININDNCIELHSELEQVILEKDIRYYFYKIGYYGTFIILDPTLNEYELI